MAKITGKVPQGKVTPTRQSKTVVVKSSVVPMPKGMPAKRMTPSIKAC